jgi:hypothetical protein
MESKIGKTSSAADAAAAAEAIKQKKQAMLLQVADEEKINLIEGGIEQAAANTPEDEAEGTGEWKIGKI